jgi:alpha-1,2-mannosyltransferase
VSGMVVGQAAGTPAQSAGTGGWRRVPTWVWVLAGAVAVAAVVRAYQLARPGLLLGVTEYDDGGYFGSAVRLLNGVMPYRDFVMVQPPGITLLMAPAAALSKLGLGTATAMAAGRIATSVASVASVAVAGFVVRHRGVLAVLVTCGVMAVYPDSVAAAHTVLVEPWLTLFCLLGTWGVFAAGVVTRSWPRLCLAGVTFGFAGAVEGWAIVPVLLVLTVIAGTGVGGTRMRLRRAGVFAAGVTAGFVVPVAPFAAASPRGLYRSVIVAQIGSRPTERGPGVPLVTRLQHMAGLTDFHLTSHAVVFIAVAIAVLIVGLTAAAWVLTRRPPPPLDAFVLATTGAIVAMFLLPHQFYYHFGAFLIPFLAMAIALPAARIIEAVTTTAPAAGWLRWAIPALTAAVLVGFTGRLVASEGKLRPAVSPAAIARIARPVPPGACVVSDQPSLLLMANRFTSDVPGCTAIVDLLGTDLGLSGGFKARLGAGKVPAVAAVYRSAFVHAHYAVLTSHNPWRIPWTPGLRAYFDQHFVRVRSNAKRDVLYARSGHSSNY